MAKQRWWRIELNGTHCIREGWTTRRPPKGAKRISANEYRTSKHLGAATIWYSEREYLKMLGGR